MKGDAPLLIIFAAIWLMYCLSTTTITVEACSCMPAHPQSHYCASDFVILARIKRSRPVTAGTLAYKVRVRKEYKLSEKSSVALKSGKILTPSDGAMCGVQLEPGRLYVLSGSVQSLKAYVSLCNMATPWEDLTKRQRRGLKSLYKHGCNNCTVKTCLWQSCSFSADSCNWSNQCHSKEGICLKQKNGKCGWTRNRALMSCLKEI